MGDEHRTIGLQFRPGGGHDGVLDRDAGQVGQARVGDVKGEERGDRWDDGMAEGFGDG